MKGKIVGIYGLLIGADLVAWMGLHLFSWLADAAGNRAPGLDNFGVLGFFIIGVLVIGWMASIFIYGRNRYDDIEMSTGLAV